jgi:DNA-directed RNA polymerase specialized sigma24 family protein
MPTDAELLAAARTDAGAFRRLYDRHADAIHRFHLRRTRQHQTALELTAETFAQAWISRGRFRDLAGGSARPWLYGIAQHVLVASVRKGRLERTATDRLGVTLELDRPAAPAEPESALPGMRILAGTDPHCTVVEPGVEYHCVLTRLAAAPEVSDLKGMVEPTVDAGKHVNGGCRSLRSDGGEWQCYLGDAAVEQQIISRGFLGEYAPEPGVG